MDVEIGKAQEPATPASCMSQYVVEHVSALMALGGIESISAVRYSCGFGSRLHVSMARFAGVPDVISAQGVIIKDALATIMSVANITRIVIKPSDKEMEEIRSSWDSSIGDAAALGGSPVTAHSGGGSDGSTEDKE